MQKSKTTTRRMEEFFEDDSTRCISQKSKKDNEYIKPRIIVLTRRYDRKMLFKRICRNTLGSSNKGIIEGINIHKISEEEWGEDPLTEESKNKNINDP